MSAWGTWGFLVTPYEPTRRKTRYARDTTLLEKPRVVTYGFSSIVNKRLHFKRAAALTAAQASRARRAQPAHMSRETGSEERRTDDRDDRKAIEVRA